MNDFNGVIWILYNKSILSDRDGYFYISGIYKDLAKAIEDKKFLKQWRKKVAPELKGLSTYIIRRKISDWPNSTMTADEK